MSACGFLFITFGNLFGNAFKFGFYVLRASDGRHTDVGSWDPRITFLAVICITFCYLTQGNFKKLSRAFIKVTAGLKVLMLMMVIAVGFFSLRSLRFNHPFLENQFIASANQTLLLSFDHHSPLTRNVRAFQSSADSILYTIFMMVGLQSSSLVGFMSSGKLRKHFSLFPTGGLQAFSA